MLANWVQETTATTGDGPITMGGAIAGYIALSDAFSDGDTVSYAVKDGNNRETGIGTYSAGVLTRTTVLETLVGGVFDNSAPAAIALSGSATVTVGMTSQSINGLHTASWVKAAGAIFNTPANYPSYDAKAVEATVNRMRVYPALLLSAVTITKLAFKVETAAADTTHLRMGIYQISADGSPGKLIHDFGDLSSYAAATGLKLITLGTPLTLSPGGYWFGSVSDSATLGISSPNIDGGNIPFIGGVSIYNSERPVCLYKSDVTGALPDPLGAVSGTSSGNPYGLGWQ
ncbi:MAG: hypothetical protein RPV21_15930 [Candidatus Sedimenticola sp. (ex Thyasira tokunagai)]